MQKFPEQSVKYLPRYRFFTKLKILYKENVRKIFSADFVENLKSFGF